MRVSDNIASTRSIKKIGHITPSCNSALEHITALAAASLADQVSNHFARIPVGNISLSDHDRNQFTSEAMLEAARSLCDAAMDVVLWNGTSACWNGTEADIEICESITRDTGTLASTTILAQYDVFETRGIRKFGLAVPYTDDVRDRSIETFQEAGYEAVSYANLGLTSGRHMAYVPFDEIKRLIQAADSPDAECVVVICTGLPAAFVVEQMEHELGKPIFDSVLVTLWQGLRKLGITTPINGWGELLRGAFAPRRQDPSTSDLLSA
jgi:maleate isomerase